MTDVFLSALTLRESDVQEMIDDAMGRVEEYTALTDVSGNAVFTFSTPFTTIKFIGYQLVTPANSRIRARISAESLSGCTVNVDQPSAVAVALIGLTVLTSTMTNVSGQTVRIVVIGT